MRHGILTTAGAKPLLDEKGGCGMPVKDSPDILKIAKYPEYFKYTHTKFKGNLKVPLCSNVHGPSVVKRRIRVTRQTVMCVDAGMKIKQIQP